LATNAFLEEYYLPQVEVEVEVRVQIQVPLHCDHQEAEHEIKGALPVIA
jgi:hypothetical protein